MNKIVLLRVLRSFITLMIGGGVIGFLHDKDILLAFILLLLLLFNLKKEMKRNVKYSFKSIHISTFPLFCIN